MPDFRHHWQRCPHSTPASGQPPLPSPGEERDLTGHTRRRSRPAGRLLHILYGRHFDSRRSPSGPVLPGTG
eukprot:2271587-Heterocapsa_arctica.AAC.1